MTPSPTTLHAPRILVLGDGFAANSIYVPFGDRARRGQRQRILFLVPPNNKCSGPLYEIVMMLETWLRRQDVRGMVDITWSTYEQGFIQAFGPRLHELVEDEFRERCIDGHVEGVVAEVRPGDGFLTIELGTRLVAGHDDIYAPGDAGDFPIKQAFLAFLQADAVAEHISSGITGREFRSPFDPVSMCIMEMFDKATFAQVPVELTGDPDRPVRVLAD